METYTMKQVCDKMGLKAGNLYNNYIKTERIKRVDRNQYDKESVDTLVAQRMTKPHHKLLILEEFGIIQRGENGKFRHDDIEFAKTILIEEKDGKILMSKAPEITKRTRRKTVKAKTVTNPDETLTFKEVQGRLQKSRPTISKLVRDGKIKAVGRNEFSMDSVESYLKGIQQGAYKPMTKAEIQTLVYTPKKKPAKKPEVKEVHKAVYKEYPDGTPTYTAAQVRNILGISKKTPLYYYTRKGHFNMAGRNQYVKCEVDTYAQNKPHKETA